MELPFTTPPQPKLPLKHSSVNLFYGVGMETVYVCMRQDSDSFHTPNQTYSTFSTDILYIK